MMKNIGIFFRHAIPFLTTILLWRLSANIWNPAGILAIIPIFYYSFILRINWFVPFCVLVCFLIDYKSDTLLYWTSAYCLFYALDGFQNFFDLSQQKYNGFFVFIGYMFVCLFILSLAGTSLSGAMHNIWTLILCGTMYMPIVLIMEKIKND